MSTPNPDEIRAPGRVIELMRGGACRVELPNGHRAVGQSRTYVPVLGDEITIAFHPYDLARGWIVEVAFRPALASLPRKTNLIS
jgi:translation initiation factor IF-1